MLPNISEPCARIHRKWHVVGMHYLVRREQNENSAGLIFDFPARIAAD